MPLTELTNRDAINADKQPARFNTVAELATSTAPLNIGRKVKTEGHSSIGTGGAPYLVSASQALGLGDILLSDGKVAVLQGFNGITPYQFGADGTEANDPQAVQDLFNYTATSGFSGKLGEGHYIDNLQIISGADVEGGTTSDSTFSDDANLTPTWSLLVQVNGATTDAVIADGTFANPIRKVNLKKMTIVASKNSRISDGLVLKSLRGSSVGDIRLVHFDTALIMEECFDTVWGSLVTTNNNHNHVIRNSVTDNTNNMVFTHLHNESYFKSGLTITGENPPKSNNKITIVHLKMESSLAGPDATHGILIEGSTRVTCLSASSTITKTATPPNTFSLLRTGDNGYPAAAIVFDSLELRVQPNITQIDSLMDLKLTTGFKANVLIAHQSTTPLVNPIFSVDAACRGVDIKVLSTENAVGDPLTNISPVSGGVWLDANTFYGNIELEGNTALQRHIRFTNTDAGTSWDLGDSSGTGTLRLSKNGVDIMKFSSGDELQMELAAIRFNTVGLGIRCTSPNGLITKMIRISNAGTVEAV